MKKLYLPCLILLSMASASLFAKVNDDCCFVDCLPDDSCDCEYTGRSFLSVRPQFQSADPLLIAGFRRDRMEAREDGRHGALEAAFFGGKSTNGTDLARYFFPFCKTVLYVDERIGSGLNLSADALPLKPQDLLAQHFNIVTVDGDFRSKITINPEQSVIGVGFAWRQSFCRNEDKGRGWYKRVSFPITRVKNKLNFKEDVISESEINVNVANGGDPDAQANMQAALSQPSWHFGKFNTTCCDQTKTRVADIEAVIGYEWLDDEPFYLETYAGIKIPTGNKPTGEYVFEPVVGNGRHWGIMWGNGIGLPVWKDEAKNRELKIMYNSHTQYLFRNTQCRSVDLVCKPWSRYMEMYSNLDEAIAASNLTTTPGNSGPGTQQPSTPGINLLTLPLKVRPGFQYNMTSAAVYCSGAFRAEAGYNLYLRQSDCVKLACPWVEGPAIKHHLGNGQQNPIRDITGNFRLENIDPTDAGNLLAIQDYKFNIIKENDLDLQTAVSPSIISHTLYGSVGIKCDERNYPMFADLGGSYEFSSSSNAVMERFLIWFKAGVSY